VSKRTRTQPPTRQAAPAARGPARGAATGGRGPAPAAPPGGRSPAAETVARRAHPREPQRGRSWLERYRSRLLGFAVAAAVVVGGVIVLLGASSPAYACTTVLQPEAAASAEPGQTPRLGQATRDLGRTHVPVGSSVTYEFCPPTSGSHYNAAGVGPIPDVFYAKDVATVPEGWVHNLEHGMMAVLYRCPEGCGSDAQAALASLQGQLPPSPICGFPPTANVVVTRFDQMAAPYAAVVWGRVLFLDSLDVGQITTFYAQSADRGPEPWCQQAMPGYTPSPVQPASPAASAAPAGSPSPSGSAASPAPSASSASAAAPAVSTSPAPTTAP
jgi:hypothetical protein